MTLSPMVELQIVEAKDGSCPIGLASRVNIFYSSSQPKEFQNSGQSFLVQGNV